LIAALFVGIQVGSPRKRQRSIEEEANVSDAVDPQQRASLVVGLGASAGGLEALQTFFANMPPDTGLAFVIVTHQAPHRASLLPLLLAKRTAMPVVEAQEGMPVEPSHVYIAPPGRNVALMSGRLHLFEVDTDAGRHLPINYFFRSLAHDQKERAVGIVLSGTGTDGTLGLKEIKAALGVSLVQAESDAGFAGMPHSAIHGDSPDLVLPVAELPNRVLSYAKRLFAPRPNGAPVELAQASEALSQVLHQLHQHTGHDFSGYKETTVRRRIERRMNLQRHESVAEYAKYLETTPTEIELLFDELLIGVTSFFRDPAAFEALAAVFNEYISTKPDQYQVRVWVAGCSTGEEAYSLAILLRECLESLEREVRVQIFATDLDPKAIEYARAGVYPFAIAGDVSQKRLKRFFVQQEHGYQVRKDVREMLVFAPQNLIEDPPFTKLDLLSCRNLLIYLDAALQKRLFPIFHYVLKPKGLLFLGSSETLGTFSNLFEPLDKKWRLSQRRGGVDGTYVAEIPAALPVDSFSNDGVPQAMSPRRTETTTQHMAEKALLRELVPPTVLMRERGDIVHIHGRTGLFLEPAPGSQASANIFNMAREGLHLELAAAVRQATRDASEVLRRDVLVKSNGHSVKVDLRVRRISEPEHLRGLFRVSFELAPDRSSTVPDQPTDLAAGSERRVLELERALQYTNESHQGTIEELETANEELKSTNEELQSTNEELQSANEELETSKEELQSLNEELQTVNVELQGKVEELSRANDDMTNLLNATDIATIFLDNDLNIKRHTAQAARVIRLIPSDVGRSIADLVSRLRYDQLIDDAREVLRTLAFKEVEVRSDGDNKWYLMRILPYRTTENTIEGLVVTFVDITRVKLLQQSEKQLVYALQHSPVTVFGVDDALRFTWAASPVLGVETSEVVGKTFAQLFGDAQDGLKRVIEQAMQTGSPRRDQLLTTVRGRDTRFDLYIEPLVARGTGSGATCVAVESAPPP
jgi:two-component system CheB/CheR fusion protein